MKREGEKRREEGRKGRWNGGRAGDKAEVLAHIARNTGKVLKIVHSPIRSSFIGF